MCGITSFLSDDLRARAALPAMTAALASPGDGEVRHHGRRRRGLGALDREFARREPDFAL
jgi:hypothetical protein